MPADAAAPLSEFVLNLQAGTKLAGCYLLKKRIEGTSRPLWLARDEVLDKDIALQFLPDGVLTQGGMADRLRQEVKRARQFVNPRALRVQELIEEDNWAAVAMESFAGQPLSAVMSENTHGFFEVAEVWPLVRELCETLEAAHQLRMVHGALSPEDVIVGEGQAKLINFGVSACLRDQTNSPFASPQQLAGSIATPADDVFAVGALLHTLLAGAPPFAGAERKGAPSISEHRRALKHHGGVVAEGWEKVIASCLAEDTADRPTSCAEIVRQLDLGGAVPVSIPASAITEAKPEPKLEATPEIPKPEPAPIEAFEKKAEPLAAEVVAEVKTEAPSREENSIEPKPESAARVDQHELEAKVRREEQVEEARRLDEDEGEEEGTFYERPHGTGPSVMTLAIIVAFVALAGFIVYRAFFADSTPLPKREVVDVSLSTPLPTPQPVPATPQPTPVAKKEPATPSPTPATPPPMASPKPMAQVEESKVTTVNEEPKKLETAIADLKQAREKAAKDLPVVKKAADELDMQQKKLADDLKKAETAATEAEKAAADRKKLAEDARKAAAVAAEQLAARKAEVAKAEEQLARMELELKDKERALLNAKVTAEVSKGREMEAARSAEKPAAAATPAPLPASTSAAAPTTEDPRAAFERKMKELGKVLDGGPAKASTPTPEASKPTIEMAKATTPVPEKPKKEATDGLTNSLGMRLVPLPNSDVLVCIWPTRVRDFEQFAKLTGLKSMLWKDPGFKQGPDHPVVNVTWQEATAFCKWLTLKEQKEGVISAKQSYRLLTDLEWSRGVGLGNESGTTPESRDMGVPDVYPWGSAWPPPTGAGNYTGEETGSDVAIKGYNDGFAWTSPVGSFPPNKLGLYDMGGNVWQWCMDSWNAESKAKVLRGASWYNGALKLSLLSSCRVHASPDSSTDNYGFRIALSGTDSKSAK